MDSNTQRLIITVSSIFAIFIFFVFLFLFMSIGVPNSNSNSNFEKFGNEFGNGNGNVIKDNLVKTVHEKWTDRWNELKNVNIDKYSKYFQPVRERDFSDNVFQPGKIFISIASYRDDQCPDTLKNIAEQADNPENLNIVICQQNALHEPDCLRWCTFDKKSKACKESKVDIERLLDTDARGPTYARWRIQQHWTGEEYFLQIDSHTRMVEHWDTILKNQLSQLSPKSVLTNYPLEYEIVDKKDRNDSEKEKWQMGKRRAGLFVDSIGDDGFFRIQSNYTDDIHSRPIPSSCWAAGFSFSKGEFIKDAGYDKYTPYLFFGEETDIALRAFTHGWDFYSPTINVCFHNYKRGHRRTFWERPDQKGCEVLSRFRLYHRLGMIDKEDLPSEISSLVLTDQIELGNVRTIGEYEKVTGVDFINEKKV